jgi:hypothetical protein
MVADSVSKIWLRWDILPVPLTPLHATSRDKYKNCRMADRARQSIDLYSFAWLARPGKALACTVSQGGPVRVECVLYIYLSLFCLFPSPLPAKQWSVLPGTASLSFPSFLALSKWEARDGRLKHWLSSGSRDDWSRELGYQAEMTSPSWNILTIPASRIKFKGINF